MPKFAANISMLFTELPFLDRFEAAANVGFKAVEFLFPYDYPSNDIATRLQANDLTLALFNLPAGDWDAGERGIAIFPSRVAEFRDGVTRAVSYAQALGCCQLHCLAGIVPEGADNALVRGTYVENVRYAADALRRSGLHLLIEPINTRDIPGYFLDRTAQAVEVFEEVGADNLFLQYDAYHMQIMEGDLAQTITRHLARIRHIQIADAPGRHEPGTGDIDYPLLFQHLDAIGYTGWVGCEYKPKATTSESLAWFRALRGG